MNDNQPFRGVKKSKLVKSRRQTYRRRLLCAELLEDRRMLAVVRWNIDTDGFWDVPGNWSTGSVPATIDDVIIDRPGANPVISIRQGVQSVLSLQSNESIVLAGGTLSATQAIQLSSSLTLSGGTLKDSVLDGSQLVLSQGGGILTGVTVNGDLTLSTDYARVVIAGGTTFDNAHLIGLYTGLGFEPGQTLSGNILFEGASTGIRSVEMNGTAGTLTIGPTGSIKTVPSFEGQGFVGQGFNYSGSMTLVNQGLISSETSGKTIDVGPASFTNIGTVAAINGATVMVSSATFTNLTNSVTTGNVVTSTLTGGTYEVGPAGTLLIYPGSSANRNRITAPAANLTSTASARMYSEQITQPTMR